MFTWFGILTPASSPSTASDEAPFKKSFFGAPVDPAAVVPVAAEEDALYLAGKLPCPPERSPTMSRGGSRSLSIESVDTMSIARAAPNRDDQGSAPMLTKKGKYGLKALSALAALPPGQLAFVGGIVEANNIPRKFLDAILSELRNADFVRSRKGKTGSYGLSAVSTHGTD